MVWLSMLFLAALFTFAVIQCVRHRHFGLLLIIVGLVAYKIFSILPAVLAPIGSLPPSELYPEGWSYYQEYAQRYALPRYISLGAAVLGAALSVWEFLRNRKRR